MVGAALILAVMLIAGFRVLRMVIMRSADSFFYPYLKVASGTDNISDSSLLLCSTIELAQRVEALTARNRELALQQKCRSIAGRKPHSAGYGKADRAQ